ncbi:MAG: hypothetical protein OXT09_10085 [Myxococcales bacterium]|nr:hypothetical protein [Myxococcales bacterium]
MKKFMLLHFGFEKPNPEIMQAWGAWFASIKDRTIENGGFHGAAMEISKDGKKDLPMDVECITGYSLIHAESAEEAQQIAEKNPFVKSIRVYEVTNH